MAVEVIEAAMVREAEVAALVGLVRTLRERTTLVMVAPVSCPTLDVPRLGTAAAEAAA